MLATASLGGTWSSCSPDFGAQGVLDRFGQIAAAGAVRHRRLPLRRRGAGRAPHRWRACGLPCRPWPAPCWCPTPFPTNRAADGATAWSGYGAAGRPARLPARGLRRPPVHHVLLGHHGPAQVHGPLGGGHPAAAPEGAPPARRPAPGRPLLLLHHLRLDDVELAGVGPGLAGHGDALRRAPPAARGRDLGLRRPGALHHPGHQRPLAGGLPQEGPRAPGDPRPGRPAGDPLHGLAPGSRVLRLGLRTGQAGRAPEQHLRRHGHHLLLRPGQPRAAGTAGRIAVPRPGHGRGRVRRGGPAPARGQGRAGLHRALPVHAHRLLERRRRCPLPRRLLRALPRRVVSRRLRRADPGRRHGHPRPVGHGAQPGGRAHRHRGDLPAWWTPTPT